MFSFAGVNGRRKKIVFLLTNVVSLACLIWVLTKVDFGELRADLAQMDWGWVALAIVADISVYVWQGFRWTLLLAPVERVPVWRSVRAIYVGLFANEVLPLRSGEVIRCYLQSRWSELPFSVTLSSAVIERIFDGVWLILGLLVTLKVLARPSDERPALPGSLVDASMVLGIFILVAAAVLGFVMFKKHHVHAAVSGRKWIGKLQVLIDDLHAIGNSRYFYKAALASLPFLLLQVLPIWALMQGYPGLDDLAPAHAFAVLVILRLGTAIPQAPGNLGIFQALATLGLKQIGVDDSMAAAFAFVLWGVVTIPLLIGGFIALAITGVRITEVRRRAVQVAEEAKPAS